MKVKRKCAFDADAFLRSAGVGKTIVTIHSPTSFSPKAMRAENCPITKPSAAQIHFALADDGRLVLDGLGEETEREIMEFCYPELEAALADGEEVASAVRRERERVKDDQPAPEAPATELGRQTNRQLDMPATLVNHMVSTAARRRLKSFKPRGNPS